MAKINIEWVSNNSEIIADLVNNAEQLAGYVSSVEEEIDALCLTQGNTATEDIPLDDDGYYLSPSLRVLCKYKLKQAIYDGYEGSSDGDVDIYSEKDSEKLEADIVKWEGRISYYSIRLTPEEASTIQAFTTSRPIGG